MAAKVQAQGAPGEVWVGQTLYETLHVSRQNMLEPTVARKAWDFVDRAGKPYALYRLPMVSPPFEAEGQRILPSAGPDSVLTAPQVTNVTALRHSAAE